MKTTRSERLAALAGMPGLDALSEADCSGRALQPCWNVVLAALFRKYSSEGQAFSWMPWCGRPAVIGWDLRRLLVGLPSTQGSRYPQCPQQPACLEAPPGDLASRLIGCED